MSRFKVGDLITNGMSAGTVLEIVARDRRWKTSGVRVQNIGLDRFDGDVGYSSFQPDYLLDDWRLVPLEWTPLTTGGGVREERYVWTDGHSRLQRELRQAGTTESAEAVDA